MQTKTSYLSLTLLCIASAFMAVQIVRLGARVANEFEVPTLALCGLTVVECGVYEPVEHIAKPRPVAVSQPAPKAVQEIVWQHYGEAKVTGYNTVPEQTDDSPCWAGGVYICGRRDVIACPRKLPKGTHVKVDNQVYECQDRLALKYDNRFDISCDKDMACPFKVTGIKQVYIAVVR